MKERSSPPVYSQIALDIAMRIARGELKENTKTYGRSVISSAYGVSSETTRRSLKLLEDMEIVEIKQNSGVIILSAEKAHQYVTRFGEQNDIRAYHRKLKSLIAKQQQLTAEIVETSNLIVRTNDKFSKSNPFQNYEIDVSSDSPLIGKSIKELNFWQETGATIIAIRRDDNIILSPGPYAMLMESDTLIFVGDIITIAAVGKYVSGKA